MMRRNASLLITALCILAMVSSASAQITGRDVTATPDSAATKRDDTTSVYGIGTHFIYGSHAASFRTLPPVQNCCTGFGDTDGYGFGVDLFVREMIGEMRLPLTARIGYRQFASPFRATSSVRIFDGSIKTVDATIEHLLDVRWHQLSVGTGIEVAILDPFFLGLGVDASYTVGASYEQSERLVTPTNMMFETKSELRNVDSGSLTDFNAINILVDLGLRLRLFQLNDSDIPEDKQWLDLRGRYLMQVTPTYNLPAEGTEPARSLRSNLITLGVELSF